MVITTKITDKESKMSENKVTVYTLAQELGVSVAAISRAFDPKSRLSREKREMILRTAEKYGYKPNRIASRLSMEPIHIGVLNFGYIKNFYTEIQNGIANAYNNLRDYKLECDMRVLQRGEHTMQEALSVLDEFYEKHYDGVIISGIYEDCVVDYINRLAKAGIRVATVHYNLENSDRLFASLSNYQVIGQMAAELCGMLLRNTPARETVLFTGNQSSIPHRILTQSFRASSEKFGFPVVAVYDTKDSPECAAELVGEAFAAHPNLAAIYVSSANSIPICRYLEEHRLSRKVVCVTSDVFAELCPYIENGTVNATIYQNPFSMGYTALDLLYHAIAEGKKVTGCVCSTPHIVLSSNLSCYR